MSLSSFDASSQQTAEQKDRRLWLWLAIPPVAAMLGAAVTIYLALAYPDPVIKAPLNKLGKVMVQDQAPALEAQRLGLSARFQRHSGGQIQLQLAGDTEAESLELLWLHATREEWDRGAILLPVKGTHGEYHGVLPTPPSEHGHWVLRDPAGSWRLESVSPESHASGWFDVVAVVR